MIAKWPVFETIKQATPNDNQFELIKNLIVTIRNTRSLYRIEPAKKITVSVDAESEKIIRANEEMFKRLARVETIEKKTEKEEKNTILVQSGSLQIFLHLDGMIDRDKERSRFEKEKAEKAKYESSINAKLKNKNFIERAKPEIILAEQEKLKLVKQELSDIEKHLLSLSAL